MSRQGMRLSRAEVDRVVSLALARPDLNPVGLSEISGVSVCRVRKLLRREDVPMPAMRRRTNMATIAAAEVHRASPGPDRAMRRSRTFPAIADAMADQWGGYALAVTA